MDLSQLRQLVRDINFSTHGLPAVVTQPNGDPVDTRVIWLPQASPLGPGGLDLQRRDPIRILAVPRSDVPSIQRGTLILVADHLEPGTIRSWKVDGIEHHDVDHLLVVVLPVEES